MYTGFLIAQKSAVPSKLSHTLCDVYSSAHTPVRRGEEGPPAAAGHLRGLPEGRPQPLAAPAGAPAASVASVVAVVPVLAPAVRDQLWGEKIIIIIRGQRGGGRGGVYR